MPVPLRCTYRVQFTNNFTFSDAESLVPYWRDLGISHLYASPVFVARAGSQHGYDVVDPTEINPELGGEAAFLSLAETLKANGLGLILDIVPNHMGIGDPRNTAWLDALEFGREGPAGSVFDIDWNRGPVLIPFLGDTLDKALKEGIEPYADIETPRIGVRYYDHVLPFRPATVAALIAKAAGAATELAESWEALETSPSQASVADARRSLVKLSAEDGFEDRVKALIAAELKAAAQSQEAARSLFDVQHWRLANWRLAQDEINYRRFFNISDLVALRAELPEVFQTTHALPLRLVKEGLVDGLRVDHVDGLSDPAAYCLKLRDAVGPDATIHVEKILDQDEKLRPWPIDGTTGYELLNLINGLFIDPAGYEALAGHARATDRLSGSVEHRVASAKRKLLTESFVSELAQLSRLAKKIADRDLATRDFSTEAISRALTEMIVLFPIYRSYLAAGAPAAEDIRLIEDVCDKACAKFDAWQQSVVRFLQKTLLSADDAAEINELKRRFQQLTSPVMAKGYEDTELYRHIVLLSVNEVGGHIDTPAIDVETFHEAAVECQALWPQALVPLATHDTKRGAGARARINVLSECTDAWLEAVSGWSKLNHTLKTEIGGRLIPEALDEELIYQTMLGSWPLSSERLLQYLSKAIREAKRRTSWENPDPHYEEAIASFAKALLDDEAATEFRANFETFIGPLIQAGRLNAFAQTLVQLTFPGVPDLYWGNEFWDLAMVDPDNRRPVDWAARRAALDKGTPSFSIQGIADDGEGLAKLGLIHALLRLRAKAPDMFKSGSYRPLTLRGGDGNWLAFARGTPEQGVIVVAPLRGMALLTKGVPSGLALDLPDDWRTTGRDILGGGEIDFREALDLCPILGQAGCAVVATGSLL